MAAASERSIKRAQKKKDDLYRTTLPSKRSSGGVRFKLKEPDLEYIQSVISSVEFPEAPTYEVKMGLSGRVQQYPLDAKVVKQSPEYKPVWNAYLTKLNEAQRIQASLGLRVTFLEGTEPPEEEWYDEKWEKHMRLIGMKIPTDPEERWLFYLTNGGLTADQTIEITGDIVRLAGIPEEYIQQAENSFRGGLRADEEPGGLEDAGPDPEGDA